MSVIDCFQRWFAGNPCSKSQVNDLVNYVEDRQQLQVFVEHDDCMSFRILDTKMQLWSGETVK